MFWTKQKAGLMGKSSRLSLRFSKAKSVLKCAIVAKLKGENALLIFACLLAVLLAVILVCASSMLLGEMGYVSSG